MMDAIEGFYEGVTTVVGKKLTTEETEWNKRCDGLTVIVDKTFDVTHDLYISLVCGLRHFGDGA